jgi:DNA-binding transcriptional MerR regulator
MAATPAPSRSGKAEGAFRTTTEVARELDLPAHVLRFWEAKFPQLTPLRRAGGRRYYRPEDVALLRRIRQCLHQEGYTIRGVQKLLREGGLKGDAPVEIAARPVPPARDPADGEPDPAAAEPAPSGAALAAALEEVRRELVAIRALLGKLAPS